MRLYAISGMTVYYMDVHETFVPISGGDTAKATGSGVTYLADGTAVENHVVWEFPVNATALASGTVDDGTVEEAITAKVALSKSTRSYSTTTGLWSYTAPVNAEADFAAVNVLIDNGAFMQLPVHRGILFGMEAMVKLNQDGISDMPKIIVKSLGSSGVGDPLDQRQSL